MHLCDSALFSFNSLLEEEQEKELEPEQDEQQEQKRPLREIPNEPNLHANVQQILQNGIFQSNSPQLGISRLSEIFRETKISPIIQYQCWGDLWYASDDFKKVLAGRGYTDCFLRPIRYFASFTSTSSTKSVNCLLVLSQHEVDQTIKYFREKKAKDATASLHMFTARWVEGQATFENESKLQLPDNACSSSSAMLSEDVMAPLYIAAGNLFFSSMKDQIAFAKYLGFRYGKKTDEDNKLFKQGLITNTGFILPDCAHLRSVRNGPTNYGIKE